MALTYQVLKLEDYSPEALERAVAELLRELEAERQGVANEAGWKEFRDQWLARKNGVLTQVNDLWLKAAPGPQKREVGQRVNELKKKVEEVGEATRERISAMASDTRLESERLDISLPGI